MGDHRHIMWLARNTMDFYVVVLVRDRLTAARDLDLPVRHFRVKKDPVTVDLYLSILLR